MWTDSFSRLQVAETTHRCETESLFGTVPCCGTRMPCLGLLDPRIDRQLKPVPRDPAGETFPAPSFSRPRVSNDNAFSESLFGTVKGWPGYPSKPFDNIHAAREWTAGFVGWYNNEHLHSGIRFVTPADRHCGRESQILENRRRVYEAARAQNPNRWSRATRNWASIEEVVLNAERVNREYREPDTRPA